MGGSRVGIAPKVWVIRIWVLWELNDYVRIARKLDNGVVVRYKHRSDRNLIVGFLS